ncbi:MAG TPA: hypothetical protein VMW24_29070 [Sedimentisphaerales bacterium]|nr:hypothetical protein [Sedimentisphaerales bacterium]
MPRVIPLLKPAPGALPELNADGVLAVMELPMREVKPELTLPLELPFDSGLTREGTFALLLELETEGVLAVMELPIRDVVLRLRPLLKLVPDDLFEIDADGLLVLIELPKMDGDVLRVPIDGPVLGDVEDNDRLLDEAGARDVTVRLERLLPTLREDPNVIERDDMDVLGLIVELLRLDELKGLELVGGRIERELILLLRFRLLRIEELGARLTLGGALTLGAGAGLGVDRLEERLLPELELFCSFFAAKTGSQRRIKAEMVARIPILTAF